MSDPVRIVLAAGGTGGHVFPAQALADALRARGLEPVLFTDRRGTAFDQETAIRRIHGGALAGQSAFARLRSLALLGLGLTQAAWALRGVRPQAVVGFGGYASVPTVMAASLTGIPLILHEQNAVLGRANRLLAKRVGRIATAFEHVAGIDEALEPKVVRVGMPVRPAFAALRERSYQPPQAGSPLRLLVLGGSQGAQVFGELVPAAVDMLNARWRSRLHITQQCRPEQLPAVEDAYRRIGISVELASFFEDVPQRLASTHLMLCRSGASTVAELTTLGCPAILVPYPFAADDHQTSNARAVAEAGGGWLMPQDTLSPQVLAQKLEELFAAPDRLAAAASAAHAAGSDDPTGRLADLVCEVARAMPASPPLLTGRMAA